jgi:hypothetical protein
MQPIRLSLFISIAAIALLGLNGSIPEPDPVAMVPVTEESTAPALPEDEEVIWVRLGQDTVHTKVLRSPRMFSEYWDTLSQPQFWRRVMKLSEDSSLVNHAVTREVMGYVDTETYDSWKSTVRLAFKDSIIAARGLPADTRLYVTSGKRYYYQFKKAMPVIDRALGIFVAEETDPWYAQTILLIESPGQIARSSAGAYGSFQLLKGVAIAHGLKVNSTVDEREDPEKSAKAAARFIKKVCIPEAHEMLAPYHLEYSEDDIWFRLLVLHVYHAGAGNVAGVIRTIAPKAGGIPLIRQIWSTQYKNFGNASQNYSQVALASLMELDRIVRMECQYIAPARP